jgi:hypothetical protein
MARLRPAVVGVLLTLVVLLMLAAPGQTAPVRWELNINPPPVVQDTTKPHQCTVTWLVTDTATSDVYASRMQIAPAEDAHSVGDRMPCPSLVPPRMAFQALDACGSRAAELRNCVFADMSRGFEQQPTIRNSAENASRCASDTFSHIGIACRKSGDLSVCNVGCGRSAEDARQQALARCAEKQQNPCDTAGSIEILAPD